jgi:hypothetical protein
MPSDVPEEVLFERLTARNQIPTEETFFKPAAKLKEWIEIFERPSPAECRNDA